ncbi:facilitated trehalose transporter Tret1-like [Choristoneura fumiferana]|uniref:facilitated trehalose transporter Tret1-like n=1 Tax=Choristoneura fumiferana TaxID=7141 RepID=UPI003D15633E
MVNGTLQLYQKKQILFAACLLLGNILVGYSLGWALPVLGKLLDKDQTPLDDVITDYEASWVASAQLIGVLIGLIISGYLSNVIGRKPSAIVMALTSLFGFTMLAVASNVSWMYAGRAVNGCGSTGIQLLNAIYIGEFASPNLRGIFMSLTGVFHTLGVLLVYAAGPYVTLKVVSYIYIGIALIHISACGYIVPESPVFYVTKGKEDDAKRIFRELGRSKDIDTELKAMMETYKEDYADRKWSQLFTIKSNRMALLITVTLFILNQAGGIMSVLFFSTMLFKNVASSIDPDVATILLGVTQFAGSIVTPVFINRCGRRILLLVSSICCSLFLAMLGAYFYLESIKHPSILCIRWMPLVALISFLFFFCIGINVIPMVLISEMFRPNVRSLGSAMTLICGCSVGLLSTSTFNFLAVTFGNYTPFWIFAAVNLFGFFFTLLVVPETKGKSLMEIEIMMRSGKHEPSL